MRKKEEEIIKPKGKVLIIFLSFLSLITCILSVLNLIKLKSMGGNIVKYLSVAISIIIVTYIIILVFARKKLHKQKKLKRNIKKKGIYISLIIYIIFTTVISLIVNYLYSYVGSFNKEYITYSTSLITLSSDDAEDIDDIKDYNIGILSDKSSVDGYIIPREIIKEHNLEDENMLESYDNYTEMVSDLYSSKLDALFITSDYSSLFNSIEAYENIESDTKVIIKKEKKVKKTNVSKRESQSKGKSVTEPFTILLMGVDSTSEGLDKNTVANGDSLILITFNPKTLNATMLSIPRDSYVPIACWSGKPENKITHAAAYGTDCMMSTIEDYFDVDIDYYGKINFKGLVSLVNAMGGIDVEVPKRLCTDDSNRGGEVCINEGLQHLDGEGALVLARNRKQLSGGDLDRGQNQQLVIQAMLNKIRTIKSAKQFLKILNTISNNFDTNFTTDQILSFYSVLEDLLDNDLAKDDADLVNIEQLYLQGTGQMIYDERAGMVLWDYIPNEDSRKDIIKAMKTNLGLLNHNKDKEFSFSINEEYEKELIGYGPYKKSYTYGLVPNFQGYTQIQAQSMANKAGVKVVFVGNGGLVINQSVPANKRIDKLSGTIKLTLSGNGSTTKDDEDDKNKKEVTTDKNKKDQDEIDSDVQTDESDDDGNNTEDNDDIIPDEAQTRDNKLKEE